MNNKILVGSREYEICLVDDRIFDDRLTEKGVVDFDVKGFIDYDDQVIMIRSRLRKDHIRELILHEIIHACLEDSGVNDESLERFVSVLSPRLVQIIDKLSDLLSTI